jgi:uncharacterized RDD family membrane protein YckC
MRADLWRETILNLGFHTGSVSHQLKVI